MTASRMPALGVVGAARYPLLIRTIVAMVALFVASVAGVARAQCPPACDGQTLVASNFSHASLAHASFVGATLVGPVFIHADLTGADFTNATFVSVPGNPTQTPDFTFANLTNARFVGAKFNAPTYLAYATLTCADFSHTNLANGNAVFGEEPLIYDPNASCPNEKCRDATCWIKFEFATMNCEFIDQWRLFDLSNADITACFDRLTGRNFDHAHMSGVSFAGVTLDGTSYASADLRLAVFDDASLQCSATPGGGSLCVDLSSALLQGASLVKANLTGASLYKAFLSNDIEANIVNAASLRQAHLKNVNLANAQLSGADFRFANFYGSLPANPNGCQTSGDNGAGFTQDCATAANANITDTHFGDAYLYGVDLRNASIKGADFSQAVVAGANFSNATIASDSNGGRTSFNRAYLQGTNLDQATISDADLTDAFVDFHMLGNVIYIGLDGTNHNQFACGSSCRPPTGDDVCVFVVYPTTTVPVANTTITCPDGKPGGASGCGTADPQGGNGRWKSSLVIGTPPDPGPPPGWYAADATYTPAAPPADVCNGKGPNAKVQDW